MPLPAWSYLTVQVPVPLVIVIVADPVPLPLHEPLLVIATESPELAVADTLNVELYTAFAGAAVPTVIVWSALADITRVAVPVTVLVS